MDMVGGTYLLLLALCQHHIRQTDAHDAAYHRIRRVTVSFYPLRSGCLRCRRPCNRQCDKVRIYLVRRGESRNNHSMQYTGAKLRKR